MKKLKILVFCLTFVLFAGIFHTGVKAEAAKPLDEIKDYTITIEVRDDARLKINYHIEWLVLDSTSEGPVTWVKVGLPNKHIDDYKKLSSSIKTMTIHKSGEVYARLDLDKKYKKDETIIMDFEIIQDYMYQVDKLKEGETVYEFTPGWFDEINVDKLTIRWKSDKVEACTPSCIEEDGYKVWTTELKMGKKYSISVTYPNTAYAFDLSKEIVKSSENDGMIFLVIFLTFIFIFAIVMICVGASSASSYGSTANFSGTPQTKITRTRVVYWPACPGCGAARPEGKESCPYCGRSLIKSEDIIKEEELPNDPDGALLKKAEGLYPTSSDPNTFIRVHVIHTPRPAAVRSSCVHSSCACACACACAGGGRAGCSTKDFYNTNLKLKELEMRTGKKA